MTEPKVRVHKFGGTSVETAERLLRAARLLRSSPEAPVVVVSALAGVTDRLAALAEDPSREASVAMLKDLRTRHLAVANDLLGKESTNTPVGRRMAELLNALEGSVTKAGQDGKPVGREREWRDAILATGEDLSVLLMALALARDGSKPRVMDAREMIRTELRGGRSVPDDEATYPRILARILPALKDGGVPVLQGFVAASTSGVTTNLGRGGSDFTAAILGAALEAPVTIWTDVDGILSADPRAVEAPSVLREMGYEEAVELAYFGAKVIHPSAAKHAVARKISLRIRNSFQGEDPGTLIRHDAREVPQVQAVAFRPGITLVRVRSRPLFMVHGFLARVFRILARHRVPVDLVATSHTSTAFTVDREDEFSPALPALEQLAEVEVHRHLATVTVVGRGLLEQPGMSGRILESLGPIPILLLSQASDVSLHLVVEGGQAREVVRRIHDTFVSNGTLSG